MLMFGLSLSAEPSISQKANLIYKFISDQHCSPIPLDEDFEYKLKTSFLKEIDPTNKILLSSDSTLFFNIRFINNGAFVPETDSLLSSFMFVYWNRLTDINGFLEEYKNTPIQLNEKEDIQFLRFQDKVNFQKTEKDLWKKIVRGLKFRVLLELADECDSLYYADKTVFMSKVEEMKLKIIEKELCRLNTKINPTEGLEVSLQNKFYDAIASVFDPHTSYFSNNEKQGFQNQLSREDFSFGLYFEEDDKGDVVISHLVPGGPAWVSNKLNDGDIILAFKTKDDKKIELKCETILALNELFYSSEENEIELTIQKQNGDIFTISLIKEKQLVEENLLHSYVLQGNKRIGYISLPGFYMEWDNNNVNGCANDFAKEIIKLKRDSVEGLIIDLRNNGGGAMHEALSLAGIFIDEGPLCFDRTKNEPPKTAKDFNRGTIYDGPMVVITNAHSASASELFAGVMQDYNRAIVVGTPTFGKATKQQVLPFDSISAFIKVTTGKFYRIRGNGHQGHGIIPDIIMDKEEIISYREKDLPYALKNDSVVSSPYFKPLKELPIRTIKEKYEVYKKTSKNERSSFNIYAKKIPLQLDEFMLFIKETEENDKTDSLDILSVNNNTTDKLMISLDDYKKEMNETVLNDIGKDNDIIESYFIINELINTLKK